MAAANQNSSQTIKQLIESRYARVNQLKQERERRKEELEVGGHVVVGALPQIIYPFDILRHACGQILLSGTHGCAPP